MDQAFGRRLNLKDVFITDDDVPLKSRPANARHGLNPKPRCAGNDAEAQVGEMPLQRGEVIRSDERAATVREAATDGLTIVVGMVTQPGFAQVGQIAAAHEGVVEIKKAE